MADDYNPPDYLNQALPADVAPAAPAPATPDDLDKLIKLAGSPDAAIARATQAGRGDIAKAIADHVSNPRGVAPADTSGTPDYLTATLPKDVVHPATATHAGWRSNGTSVEWFDPNNPKAATPGTIAKSAFTGAVQGAIGMATPVGTGLENTANVAAAGLNYLRPGSGNALLNAYNTQFLPGTSASSIVHGVFPTATDIGNIVTAPTGGYYQPQNPAEQYAQTAGSYLAAIGLGGATSIPGYAARLLTRVLAPAAAGQYAQGQAAASTNPLVREAAPLIGDVGAIAGGGAAELGARAPGAAANLVRATTQTGQEALAVQDALATIHHFANGPVPTPHIESGVPGVQRTLAEAAAPGREAGVASLQNAVQDIEPNSPLHYRAEANNTARQNFFDQTAGSPEDIERAAKARDVAANVARKALFPADSTAQVDLKPVQDTIGSILKSPERGRTAVSNATTFVQKAIDRVAKDGSTDPETAYQSIRKEINDYISGKLNLNDKSQMLAASHLIQIRDALDNAIEKAAPGFNGYLRSYSESSGPINAMEFLQKQNIATAQGTITPAGIQRALTSLKAQQAASGVKAGKSVTQAQEDALEAIRDDLLRQTNITRFRSVGSNTVQKFLAQKRLGLAASLPSVLTGSGAAALAGEFLGQHIGVPFLGEAAAGAAGYASHALSANPMINARAQQLLTEFLLDPKKYAIARDAASRGTPMRASELLMRATGQGLRQ